MLVKLSTACGIQRRSLGRRRNDEKLYAYKSIWVATKGSVGFKSCFSFSKKNSSGSENRICDRKTLNRQSRLKSITIIKYIRFVLCYKQSTGLFKRIVCLELIQRRAVVFALLEKLSLFSPLLRFFVWFFSLSAESAEGSAPQPCRLERRANFYILG